MGHRGTSAVPFSPGQSILHYPVSDPESETITAGLAGPRSANGERPLPTLRSRDPGCQLWVRGAATKQRQNRPPK
ncbi:hypothetical protein E2C01_046098 [Portunus trituberculatus]|uniref:Uncharacterized protein n=1 Tax=Portunus trituberculatus TaxID=210409 RepID=A0A5B7G464_PORTR|nr:hypothetical protein [Portunus trituberculatus]